MYDTRFHSTIKSFDAHLDVGVCACVCAGLCALVCFRGIGVCMPVCLRVYFESPRKEETWIKIIMFSTNIGPSHRSLGD